MDFTINTYKNLLTTLQKQGFLFQTFAEYIEKKDKGKGNKEYENPKSEIRNVYPVKSRSEYFTGAKSVILRHDVDALPQNSLHFAHIQAEMGIKGTYYFRIVPQSFDASIIKEIAELGHEIGYHYETMDTCNGNVDQAYDEFCRNLEKFQKLTEIKTISMHGSPLSKFDNRDIWKKYSYKKLGLLAEPYFDIDFNHLFYLTDTGRRWDGHRFNVRDKPMVRAGEGASKRVGDSSSERRSDNTNRKQDDTPIPNKGKNQNILSEVKSRERSDSGNHSSPHQHIPTSSHPSSSHSTIHPYNHSTSYRTTHHIIRAIQTGTFPPPDNYRGAMLNFHPQRWHNKSLPWLKEFIWQNVKNQGKRVLIAARKK